MNVSFFLVFIEVEEAVMLMDQQTKRHRGFGFVTFESEDVVDRICEIHFHTIKGKKVCMVITVFVSSLFFGDLNVLLITFRCHTLNNFAIDLYRWNVRKLSQRKLSQV